MCSLLFICFTFSFFIFHKVKRKLEHENEILNGRIRELNQEEEILNASPQLTENKEEYTTNDQILLKESNNNEIIQRFKHMANVSHKKATKKDWAELKRLISEHNKKLDSIKEKIKPNEFEICILIKLGFSPSEIGIIQGNSLQYIANIRKRLYGKIFGKDGSAKDFDKFIKTL